MLYSGRVRSDVLYMDPSDSSYNARAAQMMCMCTSEERGGGHERCRWDADMPLMLALAIACLQTPKCPAIRLCLPCLVWRLSPCIEELTCR